MPSCTALGKIFQPILSKHEYINDMLDVKLAIYTPFSVHMSPGIFLTSSDDIETFSFKEQMKLSKLFDSCSVDFVLIAHQSSLEIGKDHGCYGVGNKVEITTDDESNDDVSSSSKSLVYECELVLQKPSIELMNNMNIVQTNQSTNQKFVYTDSVFYFTHNIVHELLLYSRLYYEQICDLNIELDAYR